MHITFLTLFPDFFTSPLSSSILDRSQKKNIFSYSFVQIRDFSEDKHNKVDDVPYGGMHGMLMKASPISKAIHHAKVKYPESEVVFFSPTGKPFTQEIARFYADSQKQLIFLCGHYEGVDQRVLDTLVDSVYRVGDAVLTGGEIPALYATDAIVRLLPGAIGKERSHQEETFSDKLFGKGEYPQYTRPEVWENLKVPEVLLSGNHFAIEKWKEENLQGLSSIEKNVLFLKKNIFSVQKIKKYKLFGLRLPSILDASLWVSIFSDIEVTQNLLLSDGISYEEELDFLKNDAKDLHSLTLSAVDLITKKVFANVSLRFSEETPHIASLGIVLQKDYWGKGLGTAIVKKICEIGFEYFPTLQKIQLDVFEENYSAQRVYEKVGFEKIGFLKNHYLKDGIWKNVFLYEKYRD